MQIVSQRGESSRICFSELAVGELCATADRLQTELSESQLLSESDDDDLTSMPESPNNDLYLSSKHLRRKMKDVAQKKDADRETIDGPHNEDALEITIAAAEHQVGLPVELYNHIAWMLTDIDYTTGKLALPTKTLDLVLSICQNLVSNATKLPMPKHVGLAGHILRQTRSRMCF